jgi:hypothetical protein
VLHLRTNIGDGQACSLASLRNKMSPTSKTKLDKTNYSRSATADVTIIS